MTGSMAVKFKLAFLAAAMALVTASGAQADTIYSNFGSTPPTFNESLGYGVTGSLAGGPGTFGAEFTFTNETLQVPVCRD